MPTESRERVGLRADQVALTERRILDAATSLFVERGYVATSLLDVAEAATVAPRTIYVRFHTKARLLVRCIETTLVGNQLSATAQEREAAQSSMGAPTLQERIDAFAAMSATTMERSAALFTVWFQASAVEPELAALERAGMASTISDFRAFAGKLAADGLLPHGVTADTVTDALWVVAGPRTMVSLRNDRVWTPEQFATWVARTLRACLAGP